MNDPNDFLSAVPRDYRGTCGELFHKAVLAGCADAPAVLAHVKKAAKARLRDAMQLNLSSSFDDRALAYTAFLDALEASAPAALATAAYALSEATLRAGMTKAERDARKRSKRPPTEKQAALIRKLGGGVPETMTEASAVIDDLLKKQKETRFDAYEKRPPGDPYARSG